MTSYWPTEKELPNITIYMNQYQTKARETAIFPESEAIPYLALGLCGEAGEVANKIKKCIRDGASYDGIAAELGDVLWYVAVLAHYLGEDLNTLAAGNLLKLHNRASKGTLRGSGDDR